jgi:ribosomal protein S18 acetylase RimI-like enzyme
MRRTTRLTDKDFIRAFLNQDRALMAYALGDLDDAFWPESTFYGAYMGDSLVSMILLYYGLEPPVLTAFGDPDGLRAVIEEQSLPHEMYYLIVPEMETVLRTCYNLPKQEREWRMVLDHQKFVAPPLDHVMHLEPEHAGALAALYKHAAGPGEEIVAFSPWQIGHGMFYGVWDDTSGELVATAGTHVWSAAEGVVAIGNVFTRPEYRGRGYASACTAAVTQAALDAGLDIIVLNVRQNNTPAIHIYETLGFRPYYTFLEGPGLMRS